MRGGKSGSRSQAGQRDGFAAAALSRRRKLCFSGGLSLQVRLFGSVTAPLPKKFFDTFWEPCWVWFVCSGRALGFGARERSERVTVRRQPHRQLRRRLV